MNQQTSHPEKAAIGCRTRARRRILTEATKTLFKKAARLQNPMPLFSFNFDDFPRRAFLEAGSMPSTFPHDSTIRIEYGLA